MTKLALAVDIGGTKLAVGLVTETGDLVARAVVATPRDNDPEALFRTLLTIVNTVRNSGKPIVCGVGCGGPMTSGGELVSPLNIPAWRSFPLRDRLALTLGLPTFVDNDAKALA